MAAPCRVTLLARERITSKASQLAVIATRTYHTDIQEEVRWLTENGLERFIDLFATNEIDWSVLRDLNDDHSRS